MCIRDRAEKDSVTGEEITSVELSEITVMARSKQVAERNGKINLDFVVTVPGELISNKWQLQLAPVAYKPSDRAKLIAGAGGVAVLAHPMELKMGEMALESLVHEWHGQGLSLIHI